MEIIIPTLYAIISISGAIWMYLYHQGKLNYSGEKEERRKKRVEKYGSIMFVAIIMCFFGAALLLIGNLMYLFEKN